MATTTPHAPMTSSTRATTTPHASPTPFRAKRCAEGQRAPPPPLASLMRDAPPPHPGKPTPACSHTCPFARGGGRCAQGGHTERGAVQPERRTARGCTASAVSSHARRGWRMRGRGGAGRGGAQPKGRPHANGGVYARGWCPPAFSQRREDVRAEQGATRARAARETEGAGTLSAPSRPVNRLRKINVK
ncbi:hypothetical protein BJY52DRAFT_1320345 [Lactarius psammicola]|nr:hypothetical protein BJY52DRAFT_1320345 [Lactarius psammicola]